MGNDRVYTYTLGHKMLQRVTSYAGASGSGEYLLLSGTVHQDDSVEFDTWYRLAGPATPSDFSGGAYSLEFLAGDDSVLASHAFDLSFVVLSNPPKTTDSSPFVFVVPYPEATETIRLKHGASVIASVAVSPHAPTVTLTSPNGGEAWGGEQTITWIAEDADGDDLAYTIEYAPDGSDWQPITTNIIGTHYVWNTDFSRGKGGAHPDHRQ